MLRIKYSDQVLCCEFRTELTEKDVFSYFNNLSRVLEKREDFALLYISESMRTPSIRDIRRIARWHSHNADALREHCSGIALYLGSPMLRGVFRTLYKLAPFDVSFEMASSAAEAERTAKNLVGSVRPRRVENATHPV